MFTIPVHRSFADALAAGLIAEHGGEALGLARGRILLPNNRAIRTVTEAFVRLSEGGLVLPRLIAIGDPELDDRIGGALDPAGEGAPVPPAMEALPRLLALMRLVRRQMPEIGAAEAMRLAADLARTRDALLIEEIDPSALTDAVADAPELAAHWERSLERLRALLDQWPRELADAGRIDLADRRNRLLRATATRWASKPPAGFTVAAGITSAAPAIAALLARVAQMPGGSVVYPGLSLANAMDDEQWEALGPDDLGRGEETHPQFHLKRLLDRMGFARAEVRPWRRSGLGAAPAVRGRAVAHAMAAAAFTDRWASLPPPERRLSGVRTIELSDPAAEAQAIAIALRGATEIPGRTAALVTPDRLLAARVSAALARWGIQADDSAGKPLTQTPIGTLLLGIASAGAERLAPVATLALVKHPLCGAGDGRQSWLDAARMLDLALRGPRPPGGLAGLDAHCAAKDADKRTRGCGPAWQVLRPALAAVDTALALPLPVAEFAAALRRLTSQIAGEGAWSGTAGRAAAELLESLETAAGSTDRLTPEDSVPLLRQLLETVAIRPAYGGHPRISIYGLLEARLQQADLMVLGGLNEGSWPALPQPDPWLAPKIRANLGLPGLEFRIGLSAHDFASALGARRVLVTRARRDGRSPTVASRLLLRLQAMTGGLARDVPLERWALAIDTPAEHNPAHRPQPIPSQTQRPKKISVTSVDRLKADPFAFYAREILHLPSLDPVDADHTAAWKGTAVHKVLEQWLADDDCNPDTLRARAEALLRDEALHPMLRTLWQPRLLEAIEWIGEQVRKDKSDGRLPLAAERWGKAQVAGIELGGRVDRFDKMADGGLALIDYKTGKAPSSKAVESGFALQLGLLGLLAKAGGFEGISGVPGAHEYWSMAKDKDKFGKRTLLDAKIGPEDFLARTHAAFAELVGKYLTGSEPFTAKLHPAFAPYGDYDQLMRLEEWYGRE